MTRAEILAVAKPILFNTDMVRAILNGRKTETRRIMKPQPILYNSSIWLLDGAGWSDGVSSIPLMPGHSLYKRAKYKPGDYLYVRETWCNANWPGSEPDYYYYADTKICEDYDSTEWKWRPSIHMPKEAARIFLRVTDVRVERLQDVNGQDILREGVNSRMHLKVACFDRIQKEIFSVFWDSVINKKDLDKYGWKSNPWVWVIQFERVEVRQTWDF